MSRNTKNRSHNRRRRNRSNRKPVENAEPKNDLTRAPTEPKPIHIDKKELRGYWIERRTARSENASSPSSDVLEKDKDYKELIINTEALERQVAMMENGICKASTLNA